MGKEKNSVEKETVTGMLLTLLILSILAANMVIVTAQETHDIAVVSVTPSSTSVEKGKVVNISVIVENQGDFTETFNLNCTYDDTLISTQTNITLTSGESKNVTFSWNTTFTLGADISSPFKIKAAASTVPGETDTGDNTLTSSSRVRVFASPYVAVVPHSTVNSSLTIGTNYNVSIYTDYNGTDITSYQFSLTWNPNILELVEVTNGELIKNTTQPELVEFVHGIIDNIAGSLSATYAYFFPAGMVTSGPGILAYVTFNVVGTGDSDIILGSNIHPAYLIGWNATKQLTYNIVNGVIMFHHIGHGFFQNAEVTHDVAVVSVTVSPTEVVQGEPVSITFTIENQGTVVEDVTVKIYYDYDPIFSVPIEKRTVSGLAIGENTTENFTWDTTNVLVGTHPITAIVSELLGETDTDDNTLRSDENVTVTVLLDAVYIRPNGSIDPPTAPIQRVGDVYTFTDNIYDEIVVERDNIVVDGVGYILQGTGSGKGISLSGRKNVTIKNLEIKTFYDGIKLSLSSNNRILGNNITDNDDYGVVFAGSSNNTLTGNSITNNHHGVHLVQSSCNTISSNNITNYWDGIDLFASSNNSVQGNSITSNKHDGVSISGSSSYNSVSGNNITDNESGIEFWVSHNNTISNNNIKHNHKGIILHSSSNNEILGNEITNNNEGIKLHLASYMYIGKNYITNNNYSIVVENSGYNEICENNIETNNFYGIWLRLAFNNSLYHNNFIDNTWQVYFETSYANFWDNGYPSGGNYWSDYTDVDLYSGPYQNETGIDGIGDTPYVIDENNQDNYPLMNPWTPASPTVVAAVDVVPNTLNLRSKGKWITAHIKLPEGYNVEDIDVSTIMLNDVLPAESSQAYRRTLMVKFDRSEEIALLSQTGEVELALTGKLFDGTSFEGSDSIRVILPPTGCGGGGRRRKT